MDVRVKSILPLLLVTALSGCAQFREVNADIQKRAAEAEHQRVEASLPPTPAIHVFRNAWIADRPVVVRKKAILPPQFDQKITFANPGSEAMQQVVAEVTQLAGVPIRISPTVFMSPTGAQVGGNQSNPLVPLTLHYSGTLKGLLDAIASAEGLLWRYDDGVAEFTRVESHVFVLTALAGNVNFDHTVDTTSNQGSNSSNTGTTTSVTTTGASGEQKTEIRSGDMSVWNDVTASIRAMLSPYGNVAVSQSSGTVTVTDTPSVIESVGAYIARMNRLLRKEVLIGVKVYAVSQDKGATYGINWAALYNDIAHRYQISLAGPNTPALSQSLSATGGTLSFVVSPKPNATSLSGSSIASALASQGDTSLMTEASLITLNTQPVPLQVTANQGYLASSSIQTTANVGSTVSLTPGTVITGFTMDFLPRVLEDGAVLLQYSMSLSNLNGPIQTITSGSGANQQSIQLPNVTSRNFMQRVMLHDGDTLVLAGFGQTALTDNRNGPVSPEAWGAGGGMSSDHQHTEIVLVLTVHTRNFAPRIGGTE